MKKKIVALLIASLIISTTACGTDGTKAGEEPDNQTETESANPDVPETDSSISNTTNTPKPAEESETNIRRQCLRIYHKQ